MCTASILAHTDTHVLMGYNSAKRKWTPFGGFVEDGESPMLVACQKFVEESCCLVIDYESAQMHVSHFYITDNLQNRTFFIKMKMINENIESIYSVMKTNMNLGNCFRTMEHLKWIPKHQLSDNSIHHSLDINTVNYIMYH